METSNVSGNNADEKQDNDSWTIIRDFVWLALARIPTQEFLSPRMWLMEIFQSSIRTLWINFKRLPYWWNFRVFFATNCTTWKVLEKKEWFILTTLESLYVKYWLKNSYYNKNQTENVHQSCAPNQNNMFVSGLLTHCH